MNRVKRAVKAVAIAVQNATAATSPTKKRTAKAALSTTAGDSAEPESASPKKRAKTSAKAKVR